MLRGHGGVDKCVIICDRARFSTRARQVLDIAAAVFAKMQPSAHAHAAGPRSCQLKSPHAGPRGTKRQGSHHVGHGATKKAQRCSARPRGAPHGGALFLP